MQLEGRTLGIIGLGHIGCEVARIGRAFGMNVLAWAERLTSDDASKAGATFVQKEELFRKSDFVTVHLVLMDATRGSIGVNQLELMKPTAWIVNTSRGEIITEAALIAALSARTIAGAALDVFDVEPLPLVHPFRTLDNVLATPHIGYVEQGQYETYYREIVIGITSWLDARDTGSSISTD